MRQEWFEELIDDVSCSTTSFIKNIFPESRFVVISQEEKNDVICREIMFILGPYILCRAINTIKINDIVKKWVDENPHEPFGKIFLKNGLDRALISRNKNERHYSVSGDVEANIKEVFYPLHDITVAAYCGCVKSAEDDVFIAREFQLKNTADLYLFAESYPFSRMAIKRGIFDDGTVYGGYEDSGPRTYLVKNQNEIEIQKNTTFASEHTKESKASMPEIINLNGINVVILICYDLFNPKLSYYLSKHVPDIILVPSMIPKMDVPKWKQFLYVRGQEIQCPIILASNEDKRHICAAKVLIYDPIKEKVYENCHQTVVKLMIGTDKLTKSPQVHWSWLLKNSVYGPFTEDFR